MPSLSDPVFRSMKGAIWRLILPAEHIILNDVIAFSIVKKLYDD